MDRKKLVLLLGALIIAIGTAFAARTMLTGGSAPAAEAAAQPTGPRVPRVLDPETLGPFG